MSCEERQAFVDYVKLVERCMNLNADPCDNFLEYACGRFKIEDFNVKNGDQPPSMFGLKNFITYIFENEQILDQNFQKAKDYIKSKRICLEGDLKQHLKSDYFNEFCGGLPAFNENWHHLDWAKTLGILYVFDCNTIFSLTLEHSDDIKEILVELNHFTDDDFSNINNILRTLELDDENLANIIKAVKIVMENLPKDLGKKVFAFPGIDLQNGGDRKAYNILELIETALSLKINEHDIVYLGEGVLSFMSFLDGLDRRLLANYLTFLVARNSYYNVNQKIDDQLVYFMPVLISTGFATYFNEQEDRKGKYLKDRFNKSFTLVEDKFSDNTREEEKTIFRLNDVEILKFVKMHYNQAKIQEEYEDLCINPNHFYKNLYNIILHGIPKSLQKYKSAGTNDKYMNSLVLAFLNRIAIHWNKPMVFHFAGQEVENWNSLIIKRRTYPPYVNVEEKEKIIKILESQGELHENVEQIADQIICNIEAIEHAFKDYKIWMSENGATVRWQNEILSTINLDCHKLFFVAFTQHWICREEPSKSLIPLILMNFGNFSNTFQYDSQSSSAPRKFVNI